MNVADSMSDPWPKRIGAITLFVEDLEAAKSFYQDVFGLSVLMEDPQSTVFNFGNTVVNLLVTSAAAEIIGSSPIGGPVAGARGQITIDVDDVDSVCAELAQRGVRLENGPMDRPWGVRTASFLDPSGHSWEIAQPIR